MPSSRIVIAVALVCCLVLTACGARRPIRGQSTTGLDRKLTTFSWIEDGDLVTFIVGTRAARYREASAYMPLEISIANRGVKKKLTLTHESFTLIDSEGNRYPVATPRELLEDYEFLDFDRQNLTELEGIVADKFAAFTRYTSRFTPTRAADVNRSNLVRNLVALPRYGYVVDMIYFPKPKTGIKDQTFELFLDSPDLQDPVFVKFEVR